MLLSECASAVPPLLECGGVIRKRQGHIVLEAYPNNARCEWTLQVDRPFTIEFRWAPRPRPPHLTYPFSVLPSAQVLSGSIGSQLQLGIIKSSIISLFGLKCLRTDKASFVVALH